MPVLPARSTSPSAVSTVADSMPCGAEAVIRSSVMSKWAPVLASVVIAVTSRSCAAVHANLALGDQPCHQVGERLAPVSDQPGRCAAQPRHTFDNDPTGRAQLDMRAHSLPEQRELHHPGSVAAL